MADADAKTAQRLARKVARLEGQLDHMLQMRDADHRVIERLRDQLDALLRNILPQPIIDRLSAGERTIADRFDDVAVLFSDFVGFTEISARTPPAELVEQLNALFSVFDTACVDLGVEKIKTIGDAYMAAAGIPGTREDHVVAVAELALAMREAVRAAGAEWQVRIGMHAGPVIAGVIGSRKYVYDIWGDTVNVASRLESSSVPDRIQVSQEAAAALGRAFRLESRGAVTLKGLGERETYFLLGRSSGGSMTAPVPPPT